MPSASVRITWVRYPLPAQHSTAPVALADKVLPLLTGLNPETCCVLPRGGDALLAGEALHRPEVLCAAQGGGRDGYGLPGVLGGRFSSYVCC